MNIPHGELDECESDEESLAYMFAMGSPRLLKLELPSDRFLTTEDGRGLEAASAAGTQLVHLPVGSGTVTVATSIDIWTNRRIHCHDHAYVLWHLSRGTAKVWMLHDPNVASLPGLLAARFPLTGVGFGLLFIVWAAARSLRFGPYRMVESGERRQLLEHLQATADFLWRGALLHSPLEALRDDLRQRAMRTSGTQAGSQREITQRIAEIAQLPPEDVDFALSGDALSNKREFVKSMQILANGRRHL
jgi:hypothetical protein